MMLAMLAFSFAQILHNQKNCVMRGYLILIIDRRIKEIATSYKLRWDKGRSSSE